MKPGDTIVEKYVLKRRLAQGGMGEIWSAWHRFTHRDFAIKLLLPELAEHQEALGRFFQEAQATGQLRHPSIVEVYDVGQAVDGRPFLVMELLHGESLEQRLAREGVLEALEVCLLFSQVCRALCLAHERGIVHRDLSTANLFLATQSGGAPVPKILDFGVSKNLGPPYDGQIRTGSGAILGSPDYMSPEQAGGAAEVDARTDVWALGIQMYECLAGATPFRAANYNALMVDIMTRAQRPLAEAVPGVDLELAWIVDACLEKDREVRLGSAAELAERLERLAICLAESQGLERPGPRRRATDRLSLNAEPPRTSLSPRASQLPTAPPPPVIPRGNNHKRRGVLKVLGAAGRSRVVLAAGSALGGTVLGVMLSAGTGAAAPSPQGQNAVSRASTREIAEVQAVPRSREPEVIPSSGEPTDLVEAMARGLGIDQSLRPTQSGLEPPAGGRPSPNTRGKTRGSGKFKPKPASTRGKKPGRVALRRNPY